MFELLHLVRIEKYHMHNFSVGGVCFDAHDGQSLLLPKSRNAILLG
jgi:hypothetical protein